MTRVKTAVSTDNRDKLKQTDIPEWIPAMSAHLSDKSFSDPDWIYEHKLDGERVVARKQKGEVKIYSRNQKQLNDTYPELADALEGIEGKWWLDGEVVAYDEKGLTSFRKLQKRMHRRNPQEARESGTHVYLHLFDCMFINGWDLRGLPLIERKKILDQLSGIKEPLYLLKWRREHGEKYLDQACRDGWEGLIAKDLNSTYMSKRSKKWQKLKCDKQQELIIVGWSQPEGERTYFGALLLGYYDNDTLRYAGKVGTGFDENTRAELFEKFKQLEVKDKPVEEEVEESDITWLKPSLVAQVGFTEWTRDGKLRHPRYLGVRRDKEPKEVVKEGQ